MPMRDLVHAGIRSHRTRALPNGRRPGDRLNGAGRGSENDPPDPGAHRQERPCQGSSRPPSAVPCGGVRSGCRRARRALPSRQGCAVVWAQEWPFRGQLRSGTGKRCGAGAHRPRRGRSGQRCCPVRPPVREGCRPRLPGRPRWGTSPVQPGTGPGSGVPGAGGGTEHRQSRGCAGTSCTRMPGSPGPRPMPRAGGRMPKPTGWTRPSGRGSVRSCIRRKPRIGVAPAQAVVFPPAGGRRWNRRRPTPATGTPSRAARPFRAASAGNGPRTSPSCRGSRTDGYRGQPGRGVAHGTGAGDPAGSLCARVRAAGPGAEAVRPAR